MAGKNPFKIGDEVVLDIITKDIKGTISGVCADDCWVMWDDGIQGIYEFNYLKHYKKGYPVLQCNACGRKFADLSLNCNVHCCTYCGRVGNGDLVKTREKVVMLED